MIDLNNFPCHDILYRRPEVKVVLINTHVLFNISNPEAYSTEMEEGDENW